MKFKESYLILLLCYAPLGGIAYLASTPFVKYPAIQGFMCVLGMISMYATWMWSKYAFKLIPDPVYFTINSPGVGKLFIYSIVFYTLGVRAFVIGHFFLGSIFLSIGFVCSGIAVTKSVVNSPQPL